MKINLTKELDKQTLISHIIVHSLAHAVNENLTNEISDTCRTDDGIIVDIKLTANGEELNFESLVKHWESQIDNMIEKKAKELLDDKFIDVSNMLHDIEERIQPEITSRLEEWEKDE